MEYVKATNTKNQPKTKRQWFSFKTLKVLLYLKEKANGNHYKVITL